MQRILLTGDLHLSPNRRETYRHAFMTEFAKLAKARKPSAIVIAGDLTEEKDRHPASLVNEVVDHIHTLATIAPVIVVEGNHDYKEEGKAFFKFLSRIPNTRWIHKPSKVIDWLMLPHTNNYKRDWADIDMSAYRYIVCHQTFNGASVGFGRELDGIPLEVLPKKATIFCGDIHVPQEMKPLVYIGAPYTVDFGDAYKSRVIEVNGNSWASVDMSMLPQKRLIKLGSDRDLSREHYNEGDIVKIKVEVDDMGGWLPLHESLMNDAIKRGMKVWSIEPVLLHKVMKRRHKVTESQSDQEVLETFAKRHDLTEQTLKVGMTLL